MILQQSIQSLMENILIIICDQCLLFVFSWIAHMKMLGWIIFFLNSDIVLAGLALVDSPQYNDLEI